MSLVNIINKISRESKANKTSWKQKAAKIGASFLLPAAFLGSFFGGVKSAKADLPTEPAKTLEADLNNDGIVNIRDFAIMANRWLEKDPNIIPVYKCGLLDEPNAVYVLQNDISTQGTCFEIKESNVMLNLNGNNITGSIPYDGSIGVSINGFDSITITNGKINNFYTGIDVVNSKYNNVLSMTIQDCAYGVSGGSNSSFSSLILKDNTLDAITSGNSNSYSSINIDTCCDGGGNGVISFYYANNNNFKDVNFTTIQRVAGPFVESVNNVFLDVSYRGSEEENVVSGGELTRAWSYRAHVQDSSKKPVTNAKVVGIDSRGGLEFAVTTGADGYTPKIWVTDYINEGGIKTNYAPFTITATKDSKSASHIYDPNGFNSEDKFVLE